MAEQVRFTLEPLKTLHETRSDEQFGTIPSLLLCLLLLTLRPSPSIRHRDSGQAYEQGTEVSA